MITVEKALQFTKLSVIITAIWPPDRDATELKVTLTNLIWWVAIVNAFGLLLPLLVSIQLYKDDSMLLAKSVCYSCAVVQMIGKTIICRVHREKLQFLLGELTVYLKVASKNERTLVEKYVNRLGNLHLMVTMSSYGATFIVMFGALFLPAPLPIEVEYPFAVNSSPVREIMFVQQAVAGFQSSAGVCIDYLMAFLLWFTAVRFELLYEKFKHVQNTQTMVQCIREHQYLLRYGSIVVGLLRYAVFVTVCVDTPALAFAGLYLISPQPLFVKVQFVMFIISAGINLYVTCLPSDYLITRCQKLADVVYESLWLKDCPKISKNWLSIIQRAHKPIAVRIPGFINELSLSYYSSVLSTAFSYFTALHVILSAEDE